MRKVYLISRSHHADSVNITLDVKGFTRRYGGKNAPLKMPAVRVYMELYRPENTS